MPRYSQLPGRRKTNSAPANLRKRLAWSGYIALFLFVGACVFWLKSILLPFVIALIIGYVLEPLVTRLNRFGLPRWGGVVVVYAALIGLITLFLTFLLPVMSRESGKLAERFNVVLKDAPHLYERFEGKVGDLVDRMAGVEEIPEEPSVQGQVLSDDEWGFGPAVQKIPSIVPPALPTLEELDFGAGDERLAEAGIPEQPRISSVRLEGGQAELVPTQRPRTALTIEQVKPGVFGVNLGAATVDVRQSGEGTYTVAAREGAGDAPAGSDLKAQVLSSMRKGLQQFSASLLSGFFTFFQGLVSGLMNALVGLIVVFLVGAFVMIDAPNITNRIGTVFPQRFQADYRELLDQLDAGLSGVVRGQLLICLVNGVLSTIGFFIFIPEYAVILGILAGIMSLIPIFGTIISSVPALLVAVTISFGHALGVLAWILGIHFIEAYLLNPNIIGRQARIHPIFVVFVLIAGEALYGMKGILLAVPAMSVVQTLVQFAYTRIRPYVR